MTRREEAITAEARSGSSVWAMLLDRSGPTPRSVSVDRGREERPTPGARVVQTEAPDGGDLELSDVLLEAAGSADVVLLVGTGPMPNDATVDALVAAIRGGADVAVANSEAGRTDRNSLRRRAGRWLVRTLLSPIESLHELSELRGGCHAYSGPVLEEILSIDAQLRESGQGAMVEILLRLAAAGASIVQTPVEPGQAPRLGGPTVLRALIRHRKRACRIARARALESRLKELADAASRAARSDTACRLVSLVVASVGLVLTLPLMILIGILVKLTSPGPVIYTQTRVGLDRRDDHESDRNRRRQLDLGGKPFNIYKFRTMYTDYGDASQVWAEPDDPRVTPLGRFLRKFRLDELPQLFNVLAGDMNIVGPRPEQPKIAFKLKSEIEGYQVRHRVPPGITGRAQVYHTYDRSVDDVRRKVAYDLEYLSRRSVREDVRIMVRTVPVVIFRRGAW